MKECARPTRVRRDARRRATAPVARGVVAPAKRQTYALSLTFRTDGGAHGVLAALATLLAARRAHLLQLQMAPARDGDEA